MALATARAPLAGANCERQKKVFSFLVGRRSPASFAKPQKPTRKETAPRPTPFRGGTQGQEAPLFSQKRGGFFDFKAPLERMKMLRNQNGEPGAWQKSNRMWPHQSATPKAQCASEGNPRARPAVDRKRKSHPESNSNEGRHAIRNRSNKKSGRPTRKKERRFAGPSGNTSAQGPATHAATAPNPLPQALRIISPAFRSHHVRQARRISYVYMREGAGITVSRSIASPPNSFASPFLSVPIQRSIIPKRLHQCCWMNQEQKQRKKTKKNGPLPQCSASLIA